MKLWPFFYSDESNVDTISKKKLFPEMRNFSAYQMIYIPK